MPKIFQAIIYPGHFWSTRRKKGTPIDTETGDRWHKILDRSLALKSTLHSPQRARNITMRLHSRQCRSNSP